MSTCAHPLERRVDLTERGLGHRDIAASLGKDHQGDTLIAVTPGPAEGHSISGPFLQRLTIGGDGLFQPCRPALALSKAPKHNTQMKTPPSKKNRRNSPKECAIFVKN
jgi:hypothetical protein